MQRKLSLTEGSNPRPLVVRCGAFGDMVLIMVLIRDLSVIYRSDVDVLTSGPWSEPLLRGQPGVGHVFTLRSRKTPYWFSSEQRRSVRMLRSRGLGPTWFCDGNRAAMPLLKRAGIPVDFIVDVKDHPLLPGEHAIEQWRRMARTVPARSVARRPSGQEVTTPLETGCRLEVSGEQRQDLARWLKRRELTSIPLIAIQVGNKRTMRRGLKRLATNSKYWPNERWAEVLRHVRSTHPNHAIVLLGTGPEYRLNQEIASLANIDRLYNAADDLEIPRLVALLAHASGLVTVDSGPAHAAAAVGCPLVVLFGKASTSLYRPWGSAGAAVRVLTGKLDGEPSMLGIAPSDVIRAWDSLPLRAS